MEAALNRIGSWKKLVSWKIPTLPRDWYAISGAVCFFLLWCWGEAGRMQGGLDHWSGTWPLLLTTLAIASSVWRPAISLALSSLLLLLQALQLVPSMEANHWPIYFGSFFALGLILWTAKPVMRWLAGAMNLLFIPVMSYLMVARRYGAGVGWFNTSSDQPGSYQPDSHQPVEFLDTPFREYAFIVCALLLAGVALLCAAAGLLLALHASRQKLAQQQASTQRSTRTG